MAFSRLVSFPTARLSATPYCPWPSGGGLCLYPFRFTTFRRTTGRSREWRAEPCTCPSTPPVKQVVDSRDNSELCAIVEYRRDIPCFVLVSLFPVSSPFRKLVPFTLLCRRSPFISTALCSDVPPGFNCRQTECQFVSKVVSSLILNETKTTPELAVDSGQNPESSNGRGDTYGSLGQLSSDCQLHASLIFFLFFSPFLRHRTIEFHAFPPPPPFFF